jgi:hypothetical protein
MRRQPFGAVTHVLSVCRLGADGSKANEFAQLGDEPGALGSRIGQAFRLHRHRPSLRDKPFRINSATSTSFFGSRWLVAALRYIRPIRGMACEPHREGFVAMGVIPASLIRIVTDKLQEKLVEHFVKDYSGPEEAGGKSGLRRSSPEPRTQAHLSTIDCPCVNRRCSAGTTASVQRSATATEFSSAHEKSLGDSGRGLLVVCPRNRPRRIVAEKETE